MNSRQSKFPVGDDPWVRATVSAVDYVARHGYVLLTSIGMNTWELTLALASEQKASVIIIIPDHEQNRQSVVEDIMHRFRLDPAFTGFMFAHAEGGTRRKAAWPARDTMIARQADILLPVSIRSGGNLDCILSDQPGKIHDAFIVPYQTSPRSRPKYDSFTINPAIQDKEWLIHFTRSASGPWPDETGFDYYLAVCRSGRDYCRSASAALDHILSTGVIYGSTRNIRHGGPVVGFTCFSPGECQNLFRYRPRLVNPYFEPYGIAIHRKAALDMDIRPVRYGSPVLYKQLTASERPYFQNIGSDGSRWKGENEWRYAGDFHLSRVSAGALRVIVPTTSESGHMARADSASWPLFVQNKAF